MIKLKLILIIITLNLFCQKKISNEDYDKLIKIGKNHAINNNLDSAIIVLNNALKIDTTRVEAYYGLGYCYSQECFDKKIKCKKAIYYLNKSIEINQDYRNAYFNRSICKSVIGSYHEALNDLNMALKKDSNNYEYLLNRAVIKLNLKDTIGACIDHKKATELGGTEDLPWYNTICK